MRSEPSLYQRLNDFALDNESASFKFSDRLARENGWSLTFARGAIAEYKKFVYLAATSPTPVTPSDVVDQVWHLHLTYSRSYWDEMCDEILGKNLHHGPTKGGKTEDRRYRDLYAATLDAYRREFNQEPPRDYWPASDARFESAIHQRWIDTRTHAVIAWRTIARTAATMAGALALSSAGAAYAAAKAEANPNGLWIGLGAIGVLAVIMLVTTATRRRGGRNNSDSGAYYGGDTGGSSNNHHHHGTDGGHHGGHGGDSGGHAGCSGGGGDSGGGGCSGGGCSSS